MKMDRGGRTLEDYRQLYWDGQKRIDELEAAYQIVEAVGFENVQKLTNRIAELEATIKKVEAVGFEVHDSWGVSEEFNSGWIACRAQVEEALLGEAQ